MGLLSKLGLGPKDAAEAVTEIAEAGADIVERWKPSERAKHDMGREKFGDAVSATEQARQYEPRTTASDTFSTWINVVVDAIIRMIRPGVAILLIGATFGMWNVSVVTNDPIVLGWTEAVVGFYFGVRAITQDLPSLILALRQLRSSK
jgi:hypothetical protein